MISKELLSEVLNIKTDYLGYIDRSKNIEFRESQGFLKKINIYELAHECKQWAVSKGYSLYSGYDKLINKYGVYVNLLLLGDDESTIGGWDTEIYFIANTEPEAIFKAYQYIMENKCGS